MIFDLFLMSTNVLNFYNLFRQKILIDIYSQGGFTLSTCSQVRAECGKKISSNLLSLRGFVS